MVGQLCMTACLQRMGLLKLQLVFPSLRFCGSWNMGKRGSLPVSLSSVISTSIRGLFLGRRVPVYKGGYGMWGIWVVVVARIARICVDSIRAVVLRKCGIVQFGIPLPSIALHYLQQCLPVCRLEKLISECVGFSYTASLRIDLWIFIVGYIPSCNYWRWRWTNGRLGCSGE